MASSAGRDADHWDAGSGWFPAADHDSLWVEDRDSLLAKVLSALGDAQAPEKQLRPGARREVARRWAEQPERAVSQRGKPERRMPALQVRDEAAAREEWKVVALRRELQRGEPLPERASSPMEQAAPQAQQVSRREERERLEPPTLPQAQGQRDAPQALFSPPWQRLPVLPSPLWRRLPQQLRLPLVHGSPGALFPRHRRESNLSAFSFP